VIKSSSEIGALNQETINHNALLQAYGYQTQAVSDTAQSQLDRAEGDQAVTAGYMGAAGGLLGNAPSVGSAPTNAEAAYNTVSSWFGS
jgi:hypothetical protein